MEESITLLTKIKEAFACEGQDVRAYSPLTLAYIGDGIYELVIRSVVVERANRSANDLHKKTTRYVKAPAQSAMIEALLPELTEEEEAVYRRGRNAKSYTTAKNASVADYRRATGFEALMGYLYLKEDYSRIVELVRKGIPEDRPDAAVDQRRHPSGRHGTVIKIHNRKDKHGISGIYHRRQKCRDRGLSCGQTH